MANPVSARNLLEAEDLLKKALALDPLSTDTLFANGMFSASAGRLKEALDFEEKGHAVDPFYPNLSRSTVQERWLNGQNDAAIELAKTLRTDDQATLLALIYSSTGRYGEAADALMQLAAGDPNSDAAQAARLLRTAPAKRASPGELPRLRPTLTMLYLYLGAPDRALENYERIAEVGFISGGRSEVWHPAYAAVRKTERFKALMRKVGLVDYWRAKGWPAAVPSHHRRRFRVRVDEPRHQPRKSEAAVRRPAVAALAAHQRPQDRAMDRRLCCARLWHPARRDPHQRVLRVAARGCAHFHAAAGLGPARW